MKSAARSPRAAACDDELQDEQRLAGAGGPEDQGARPLLDAAAQQRIEFLDAASQQRPFEAASCARTRPAGERPGPRRS